MYKPWVREIIVKALREEEQTMLVRLREADTDDECADLTNDIAYLRSIITSLSDVDRYHTTGFMCKIDWECELGMAAGGTTVYPDLEDLKSHRVCVDRCGIVEVVTSLVRVIKDTSLGD
jgi:hypothetical protein